MVIFLDEDFANSFGKRVKAIRTSKELTQEDVCLSDGEKGMDIRTLRRIENGKTFPNLKTLTYLSNRLEVPFSELMGEQVSVSDILPQKYLNLKYRLIRTTTYRDKQILMELEEALDDIYNEFYDDLPTEEKEIIDILQARLYNGVAENPSFGNEIILKYKEDLLDKVVYDINDLFIIRLIQSQYTPNNIKSPSFDKNLFTQTAKTLLKSLDNISNEYLFLLRDAIIMIPTVEYELRDPVFSKKCLTCLSKILEITQDYQKQPIVKMLEWRYNLFVNRDLESAKKCYEESISMAKLMNNRIVVDNLNKEWDRDIEIFNN